MSRSSTLFAGLFGSFAVSCLALVLAPQAQLGGLQPTYVEEEGAPPTDIYPVKNDGIAAQGRTIYAREGCIYCHSQQVRGPETLDMDRGWGARQTVARDYIYDQPAFLGNYRVGPDLSNVGSPDWRNEPKQDAGNKPAKRDAAWHLLHLYVPRAVITDSNHPPYRYLFDTQKIVGQRSADALNLSRKDLPGDNYEVVPTPAAKALVGYLMTLDRSHALPEVKTPAAPGGAPAAEGASAAAPAQ